MATLKLGELTPGGLYKVVDPGDADAQFKDAIVLGSAHHIGHRAVTIQLADRAHTWMWAGTVWTADDNALFERIDGSVTIVPVV